MRHDVIIELSVTDPESGIKLTKKFEHSDIWGPWDPKPGWMEKLNRLGMDLDIELTTLQHAKGS